METVRISPEFQVVIPRRMREAMGIRPGEEVQLLQYEDRIEMIPVRSMRQMRGFLKGIDSDVPREGGRV